MLVTWWRGESVAMVHAASWIVEKETDHTNFSTLILTDSDSLVNSIGNNEWRIKDRWLLELKRTLAKTRSPITILWIPSHCGIDGNETADRLANAGTKKSQTNIPVTHAIVKAKIKGRTWQPTHPRAVNIYGSRRGPREDIESKWPRRV